MTKSIIIAVVIAVIGFIPLMGTPGALAMYAAWIPTNLIYGPLAWEAWMNQLGDKAWPTALMLNFIWPISIPLGYFMTQKLFPSIAFLNLKPLLVFFGVLALFVTLLGQVTISLSGDVKRLTREEIVSTAVVAGNLRQLKRFYQSEDLGMFKQDPLTQAIFGRQTELAIFLINRREVFDQYVPAGDQDSVQFASPLHTAINVGAVQIAKLLLERGANPSVLNALKQSPVFSIHWNPEGTGAELVLLKEHDANFQQVDANGDTPLIHMVRNVYNSWDGMTAYVQIMIDAGVDHRKKNNSGYSAIYYAKENHHAKVVEMLEKLD